MKRKGYRDGEKEKDKRKGSDDLWEKRRTGGMEMEKENSGFHLSLFSMQVHILYTSRGNGMAGNGKGRVSSKFVGKRP